MKANWFIGPCRPTARVTRLPQPHRSSGYREREAGQWHRGTMRAANQHQPTPASAKPTIWLPATFARAATTASNSVKNDCDCSTSDARPGRHADVDGCEEQRKLGHGHRHAITAGTGAKGTGRLDEQQRWKRRQEVAQRAQRGRHISHPDL